MPLVFISYVEEDGATAVMAASSLEEHGYQTWYFQRDSVPGPTYLRQVQSAIAAAEALLIVISPATLGSRQVAIEIVRGHESGKHLIPVLIGITFEQLKATHGDWALMFGGAVAVSLDSRHPLRTMTEIVRGMTMLGLPPPDGALVTDPASRTAPVHPQVTRTLRPVHGAAGAVLAGLGLMVGLWVTRPGPVTSRTSDHAPLPPPLAPLPQTAAPRSALADDLDVVKGLVHSVSPLYDSESMKMFGELGKRFYDASVRLREKHAGTAQVFESLSESMYAHAKGSYGSGSGWLIVDPTDAGRSYIVTNAYVIGGGDTVMAEAADSSATQLRGSVIYVDDTYDLAVIAVQNRSSGMGLDVDGQIPADGTPVWAAAFPNREWSWQHGFITNAKLPDSVYGSVIGHDAKLDPGSRGGPLLAQDTTGHYHVVGVNTWKRIDRSTNNFIAIPARYVLDADGRAKQPTRTDYVDDVIGRAKHALRNLEKPAELRRLLEHEARTLASELSSASPNADKVTRYFSYAMVAANGNTGVDLAIASLANTSGEANFIESWKAFETTPAEFIRLQIVLLWLLDIATSANRQVEFKEVTYSDQNAFGRQKLIRTNFTFGGSRRELSWTYEQGHWRLAKFEVDWAKLAKLAAASVTARGG
jgi:S1-C subfamily serine protease